MLENRPIPNRRTIAAPGAPPLAELRGAAKRYGKVTALEGLDLALRPGELLALLGTIAPDAGSARLFGGDPRDTENRVRMGTMLQISKVPETLTVREHLELFASYYPHPLPLSEVLAAAGLEALAGRRFGKLSGGERQRLLFALALVGDPELLVLDEPTVGLDVASRRRLWEEIRRFVGRGGSVLLTTHYLEEADALADRVMVLHHGAILAEGKPAEIKARAAGRRIRCLTRLTPREVAALPGVSSAAYDGPLVETFASEAEPVVRELLAQDPGLSGLEVTPASLEEAFLTLTEEPPGGMPPAAVYPAHPDRIEGAA